MSADFKTVLIEDARIADITAEETFGVQSGASQTTYQQFQAVSTSNSTVTFNVQVPSENIVIDRHLLLRSDFYCQLTITNVPNGSSAFQYGATDAFQAFPLNSLFTTIQSTINNVSVSTNLQDVLPMLLRMNDPRELNRYNSMTPALPDCVFGNFADGAITAPSNANALASVRNTSYDIDFVPRGAFQLLELQVDRYNAGVGGAPADNSAISQNVANTFVVSIHARFTEPFLALSPFLNCAPDCRAGLVGVNNMTMVLNIDSTLKRVFSTANSAYTTSIALGWPTPKGGVGGTSVSTGLQATQLLFNFLSLQPEQYAKISTKNVVPYLDYPRYLSTSTSVPSIPAGTDARLTSQSIQLNQVPDLILISVRKPMSQQTIKDTSSFLTIRGISINFNNASGLLATAQQQDLYEMSYRNGSAQTFYEFSGKASIPSLSAVGVNVTAPNLVPTTGSLLVLNPVMDFSLPSYLSSSSLGQYQFQFNIDVTNQFGVEILNPEICIITVNSGIFVTQQGTSQIFTGILTKNKVLETKEQNPVPHLDTSEYKRIIGGVMANRGMGNVGKMMRKLMGKIPLSQAKKEIGMGGASSGGAMSGGAISGGKSKSKLAKFINA